MKKMLSLFIAVAMITVTIFAFPSSASAAEYTPNKDIYAKAYMLVNLDDDSYPVVAEKNADMKLYPASLTKIVTAMVTLNNVSDLSQKTTVSQSAYDSVLGTGAQVAGLSVGDELTIEQLLYLAMVHSACDACQVLAEYVAGDVGSFVAMMNDYASSLGCKNTNFVNPDGLHDDNHYTTASDMELITLDAIQNETFNTISSTVEYEYNGTNFYHTNLMLQKGYVSYYYEYAQGIKTGSTDEAGYCVITKASKDGYNYLAIVMDSPRQKINGESYETKCSFIDAASLFDWAFESLKYATVIRQNDIVTEVPVSDGKDADTVQLVAQEDIRTLVPSSFDSSAVIIKPIDLPTELSAPVTKDTVVCQAEIIYGEQVIATVNLVTAQNIEMSTFLKIINSVKSFLSSKIVLAVVVIAVALVVLYILVFIIRLQKDKKRRQAKKKRHQEFDDSINSNDDYLPPPKR